LLDFRFSQIHLFWYVKPY